MFRHHRNSALWFRCSFLFYLLLVVVVKGNARFSLDKPICKFGCKRIAVRRPRLGSIHWISVYSFEGSTSTPALSTAWRKTKKRQQRMLGAKLRGWRMLVLRRAARSSCWAVCVAVCPPRLPVLRCRYSPHTRVLTRVSRGWDSLAC